LKADFLVGTGGGGGKSTGELKADFFVGTGGGGGNSTGELAANPLCAGAKCVVGAAAAVIADRAMAEPSATHETFNHDEDILVHLSVYKGTC